MIMWWFDIRQYTRKPSMSRPRGGGKRFDSLPTWKLDAPHSIQRFTRQNRTCNSCHGNAEVVVPESRIPKLIEEKVFNMMGSFEGGKNKNKDSVYYGKRWAGGWKLEGLPWAYKMKKKLMYQADMKKIAATTD